MEKAKLLQANLGKPVSTDEKVEVFDTIKGSLTGSIVEGKQSGSAKVQPKQQSISAEQIGEDSLDNKNPLLEKIENKLASKFDFFKPIVKAARELRGESKDSKVSKESKELLNIEKQQTNYVKSLLKETTIIRLLVEKISKVKYDPRAKGAQFRDDSGRFVKLGATGKELKPFGPTVSSVSSQQMATTQPVAPKQAVSDQVAAPVAEATTAEAGPSIGDIDISIDKNGRKEPKKSPSSKTMGRGASKLMTAGKILGATATVGLGAYAAYQGWNASDEEKKSKLEELDAAVQSGEITPQEAEKEKKKIEEATVEKKSGVVGEGTGMAAGAIAGAKLGATVGTFIGGPIGTGVGALAGGALGALAGSSVGKKIGEYGGKAINAIGNFFGSSKESNVQDLVLQKAKQEGAVDAAGNIIDKQKYEAIQQQVQNEIKQSQMGTTTPGGAALGISPGVGRRGAATEISKTSAENVDIARDITKPSISPSIVSTNNIQTNKQEMVAIKASPRSESSFTRYMERAAAW